MRAIPKKLLIHTAAVYQDTKTGSGWNGATLERIGQLMHVRIEPSSRVVRDKNNREQQLAATLFFDCRNSQNTAGDLKEDLIVDFQGQKHRIVSVEPLCDENKLHHYEIGMVRYAD